MIAQVVPVLLAFGSNLGDRTGTIRAAQRELADAAGILEFATSPLRETIALTVDGPDASAPRYVNGVARATTTLSPHELLDLVQTVESIHGRTRDKRWGDRTLDIDVIFYGGKVIRDERLTVPHPRAFERDFVLAPWLALEPEAVLMGHGRVAALLDQIGDTTLPLSAATVAADAAAAPGPPAGSQSAVPDADQGDAQ